MKNGIMFKECPICGGIVTGVDKICYDCKEVDEWVVMIDVINGKLPCVNALGEVFTDAKEALEAAVAVEKFLDEKFPGKYGQTYVVPHE